MVLADVMSLFFSAYYLAVSPSASCNLSIYSIDESGQRRTQIISPADVASIDYGKTNADSGQRRWLVVLTDEGAAKNATFTKSHIGKRISVTCDDREIERPMITGEFSGKFEVVPHESK
ncbi:MAG TPA: hypothetical protein VHW73_10890 [Rudaea sp.]|jgi:preprotein translocase subunit SecD|nr:hypothetical protein [Rudaea sp.]